MKLVICFIFLGLVTFLDGRYRCDYTYFPDAEGWMKLHRIPANWREARLRCHFEGGNLASPLNNKYKQAMRTLIAQNMCDKCAVFTGIHATFSRGDFFSVEGVILLEIPHTWEVNEPDNFKDSDRCTAMTLDGNLADVNCDEPYPYICFKKAPGNVQLNSCGTLDSEYTLDLRTGSCYKLHTVARTWSRAYMACAAEGGHLAIVNSETEATVLRELFAKYPAANIFGNYWKEVAFIGFHDWGEHGDWLTIDGRTLKDAGYTTFETGEPNNLTAGQFCGGFYRRGVLDDLRCEDKFAFMCEKRPDSPLCPNSV